MDKEKAAGEIRVGVALVVRRGGDVLMGQRYGSHGEGTWCFPGGHMEYGETPEEACLRELAEECGEDLVVGPVRQHSFFSKVWTHLGRHYITLYLETDWVSGIADNAEKLKCSGWGWMPADNVPTPLFESCMAAVAARPSDEPA